MDIIPGLMNFPGIEINWSGGIAVSKGYNYDKNDQFWKTGLPPNFETQYAWQNALICRKSILLDWTDFFHV